MLAVRVTTRAGRDAIEGVWHDAAGQAWLAVRVAAAPSDGVANDAIISMLCIQLSLKKRDVSLVRGVSARLKRFKLNGDAEQLARAITVCMEMK